MECGLGNILFRPGLYSLTPPALANALPQFVLQGIFNAQWRVILIFRGFSRVQDREPAGVGSFFPAGRRAA
jgi:hypothetical protein